jgi:hypothetical protein
MGKATCPTCTGSKKVCRVVITITLSETETLCKKSNLNLDQLKNE